jgi:methionyl-tRNA formyltransferase
MLARRSIRIGPDDTAGYIFKILSTLGANLLIETLPDYLSGDLQPEPQPEEGATYAPMLKKEDGRLDFDSDVFELERRVRAFNPWPGAFMHFEGTMLKVHRAHVEEGKASAGERLIVKNQPAIGARGGLLVLDEVQPAGKRSMNGKSFLAGARNWA